MTNKMYENIYLNQICISELEVKSNKTDSFANKKELIDMFGMKTDPRI